jgi:hypothetical protein
LNEIEEKVELNAISRDHKLVEGSSQVNLGIQVSNPDPWNLGWRCIKGCCGPLLWNEFTFVKDFAFLITFTIHPFFNIHAIFKDAFVRLFEGNVFVGQVVSCNGAVSVSLGVFVLNPKVIYVSVCLGKSREEFEENGN